MFRSTRPSSQSYQVGTLCGEPSGRSVATTAGFGRRRNSSTSGGTGTLGTSAHTPEHADVHTLALVDYLTKLPAGAPCELRHLLRRGEQVVEPRRPVVAVADPDAELARHPAATAVAPVV